MKHIETERLLLRDWIDEDLTPFFEINQDEKVIEFLPGAPTKDETKAMIAKAKNHIKINGFGRFACEEKETGRFIGFVGLEHAEYTSKRETEIFWRLGSHFWGKGYATEAAKALLERGFRGYKLNEIISVAVTNNMRSRRVMEKIGLNYVVNGDFQHPRVPKDHRLSWHVLYRLTKERYEHQILD